jgi:hypothetical protein
MEPKTAPIGELGDAGGMAALGSMPSAVSPETSVVGLGRGGSHAVKGDFAAPAADPADLGITRSEVKLAPMEDLHMPGVGAKPIPAEDALAGKAPAKSPTHGAEARHATSPAHSPSVNVEQGGPEKGVNRQVTKGGPERTPEVESPTAGGKDPSVKEAIKEAKHDGSMFGPMKQYIMDNPLMVAGAVAAIAAAMGGGWKWSLVAAGVGFLGTKAFSQYSETSKKAEGFDKIAKLQGEAGPKKA